MFGKVRVTLAKMQLFDYNPPLYGEGPNVDRFPKCKLYRLSLSHLPAGISFQNVFPKFSIDLTRSEVLSCLQLK